MGLACHCANASSFLPRDLGVLVEFAEPWNQERGGRWPHRRGRGRRLVVLDGARPRRGACGADAQLGERPADPPSFASGVIDDVAVARRFAAFFAISRDAALPGLAREENLGEALGEHVGRHGERGRPRDRLGRGLAVRVRDVLAERFADAVTLADLEAVTGADRFRLIRAFRSAFGLPPHAWQVQVRLARARSLIRAGAAIAAAAAATGFADQSHLTRMFKRSYGYTPGAIAARGREAMHRNAVVRA